MKETLITSSVLIGALLLLRLIFAQKVGRTLIYGAWLLVALRLLIPVQIGQLDFSVLTAARDVTQNIEQVATRPVSGPSKQEVYQDIVVDYLEKDQTVFVPQVQEQIRQEMAQGTTNPAEIADKIQQQYPQQEVFIPQVEQQVQQQVAQAKTAPTLGQVAKVVWLAGMAGMAVWFAVVNVRYTCMLRRNRERMACENPIPVFVSDQVDSPCLVGLFHPVIYLTPRSAAQEETLRHVLTHELTHYRHCDHIWSMVRCICLCVYWFDPLVWLAAYLSRRDCELACDEGAMKILGEAERLAYGKTLLEVVSHASAPAHLMQTATSMNETKKQLKERVGYIVKKPKFSIIAAISMVLICAIVTGCVAAGPAGTQHNIESEPPVTKPTSTPTTSPSTTGSTQPNDSKPTDPVNDDLAKFNALFGDLNSWYNKALTSQYATPAQLDLVAFFIGAFREDANQVTDSERALLKNLYDNPDFDDNIDNLDITRLPVDRMNQVLQAYFGITLEDVDTAGFVGLDYLESTECYYIIGGGASAAMDFNALSVEHMEDGSIRVYYTANWSDTVYVVTLMPHGDGYKILSNLALSEPKPEPDPAPTEPAPTEPAPTEPAPTEPAPTEPAPTEPAPTEPAPTEPAPTEPAPTEPAPTEPAPTEPAPTEPAPTEPDPTEPEPEPSISDADKELYDRAVAALDAYAKGERAYYYDDNGEYYDQDALWQICALLIRLEDYGDSAAYLQKFSVLDLLVSESWKYYDTTLNGGLTDDYTTKENASFAYDEAGNLIKMRNFEVFRGIFPNPSWDLEFFYEDGRLDHYNLTDEGYVYTVVYCIYDDQGRLIEEKLTEGLEFSIYYSYDTEGRLSAWEYEGGDYGRERQEYTYDAQGRLLQTNQYSYIDAMGGGEWKLVGIQTADYSYDKNGFLQSVSTEVYGVNNGERINKMNVTATYTYDDRGCVATKTTVYGPLEDMEGNVQSTVSVRKEEVTYSYETVIFYNP